MKHLRDLFRRHGEVLGKEERRNIVAALGLTAGAIYKHKVRFSGGVLLDTACGRQYLLWRKLPLRHVSRLLSHCVVVCVNGLCAHVCSPLVVCAIQL